MINRIILLLMLWIVLACNQASKSNDVRADSLFTTTETGINTPNEFHTLFPELVLLYQQDPSFTLNNFNSKGSEDSLMTFPGRPLLPELLSVYGPLFIYNSDSSLAIDLYSYNYIPVNKENGTKWERGEADTEVALIDLVQKKQNRIFFAGPSYTILDARWIDKNIIALAIAAITDDQKIQPGLIKINLQTQTRQMVEYNDTLQVDISRYTDNKINKVKTTPAF
jgi:hypothetical protein